MHNHDQFWRKSVGGEAQEPQRPTPQLLHAPSEQASSCTVGTASSSTAPTASTSKTPSCPSSAIQPVLFSLCSGLFFLYVVFIPIQEEEGAGRGVIKKQKIVPQYACRLISSVHTCMFFIHLPIHTDRMEKEGKKTTGQNAIIKSILNIVASNHAHPVKLRENKGVSCKLTHREYHTSPKL
jgi:hypothetical protein